MTVASTLAVSARADGFLARLQVVFATPVVEIDGVAHPIAWLTTHRFVVAPGQHVVRMYFRRHDSTGGHCTTTLTTGPGESVHLDATLTGKRFVIGTSRARTHPLDGPQAV
ncbi:MAG: hypothetical protein EOL91_04295 [Actinobacteria bacterium]|jgi:hypothetical protein|nr:hypothetical protein [Actinomycetota bacterium]